LELLIGDKSILSLKEQGILACKGFGCDHHDVDALIKKLEKQVEEKEAKEAKRRAGDLELLEACVDKANLSPFEQDILESKGVGSTPDQVDALIKKLKEQVNKTM
jgi:hypothetical protein